MIKIIPFFSSLSSDSQCRKILSQLLIEEDQIITDDHFFSKEYTPVSDARYYLFVGTGGTESDLANFIQQSKLDPPIILLSYDLNNSLPAAMETRKYLDMQGIETQIIHGTLKELATILQESKYFSSIKKKLKDSRIGVIGVPSDWLIASQVNEKAVEKVWGTNIVYIPISKLLDFQVNKVSERMKEAKDHFINRATEIHIPIQKVKEAGLVAEKLLQLTQKYQLDALTVECFTLLQNSEVTSCYALSYLNDQGIVAGCEGDIPSTFTMLVLNLLTDQTPFMGNVVHINSVKNTIRLAHCTVPLEIVDNYSIYSHFESERSVAIRGKFKLQEDVTILKISGEDLTNWWVTQGRIIANIDSSSACRTHIEVALEDPVEYFLKNSLANHHILILGNHKEKVQRFLEFVIKP